MNEPEFNPYEKRTLHELKLLFPELHPMTALALTLHPMARSGEINPQEYLELSGILVALRGKPLFTPN